MFIANRMAIRTIDWRAKRGREKDVSFSRVGELLRTEGSQGASRCIATSDGWVAQW